MIKRRNSESGFALLFVYAMAATVAIMLYMALPRVAFEAQRDKEQMLIDRGEQYSRAINLYVRKFNKYPPDFEALQNTQNLRFLRHKYIDPMTGKDDWRIVHVGPGGVFTDSLIYTRKKDDKQQAAQQNFITELQQTGGNQLPVNIQGANVGTRLRQSDQPGAPGDPTNPNQSQQAGLIQPQPALIQQALPQSGEIPPAVPQFDANGQPIPNPANANTQPGFPGGLPPGIQLPPDQQFPNIAPGQPLPGQQQGPQSTLPPTSAAALINQILTSPRPGGLPGIGGAQPATVDQYGNPLPNATANNTPAGNTSTTGTAPPAAAGQTIGGGIAGVASKLELDGIKVYKDQKSYNKWEFVYDISKDPARTGATQMPAGTGAPTTGVPGTPSTIPGLPNTPGAPAGTPTQNTSPTPSQLPAFATPQ